jgi:hypothetical protein
MVLNQIDSALMVLGLVGQSLLLLVLLNRRFYRTFPIFFSYILYCVLTDLLFVIWFEHVSKRIYFEMYFASNVPEFLLELGVLFEVARSVVNPVKRSLPKSSLLVFGAMVVSGTMLACFLSIHSMPSQLTRWSQYFVQVHFTLAILRVVIFSAIVSFSQILGIGWKNHVMQIATGFAGYSLVILIVELLHRFSGVTNDGVYHYQEQLRIVAWCAALGYWSYALAKKEAPRKEFSPQMAKFLISISRKISDERSSVDRLIKNNS